MEKLYYSISEIAGMLGETVSCVRFWSDSFPQFIRPTRNAKGNRLYKAEDIDTFRQIQYLVKVRGLKLEGAARQLAADRTSVDRSAKALESLRAIRAQLVEVKNLI